MPISALLETGRQQAASDLHLSSGEPPCLRVQGRLQRLAMPALSSDSILALLQPLLQQAQLQLASGQELDFAVQHPTAGRLRMNIFWQQRGVAAAIRLIAQHLSDWQSLGLPDALPALLAHTQGLLLVVGATGSGKSTSLAAMVQHINQHQALHIITLEDPIEYVHTPQRSWLHQRELGRDTASWHHALRACMRQDPDVIMVGEMRDLDTLRLALSAAETGHLVLATLHANSAARAVERMVDAFPTGEKELVRQQLAEALCAVLAQTLLPQRQGTGRVLHHELLVATPAVRNVVREGRMHQLPSLMQTGATAGMHTFAQHLQVLQRKGWV